MTCFKDFVEAMINDGVLERITDAGIERLFKLYSKNDLTPPTDLIASMEARGLITKE